VQTDLAEPLRFLHNAFEPNDLIALFVKSYTTGRVAQRTDPLSLVLSTRFQAWLAKENHAGVNIYVGVNAIRPRSTTRRRSAIATIRHVFLDADHDGEHVVAVIRARRDLPPPTFVLHSSPDRVHVLWRVFGFEPSQVEALQRQLARELGTDVAATPSSQTTRLPGFFNHKYQTSPLVRVEYGDTTVRFGPADFPAVPPTQASPPARVRSAQQSRDYDRVLRRAESYLAAVPAAIAGQHGDLRTFRVCCRLVRGFALADVDALKLLTDWNARCKPPWAERELLDKLQHARRYGREAMGGLLEIRA
jgi:hypothetical protein